MISCSNPSSQFRKYQSEIEASVLSVMRSNNFVLGKEVSEIEQNFAKYIGVSNAIGVANGTDAIEIALRALDIGIGDEVITVSHTAVATVSAIESVGAKPILLDVEPDFYTLDVSKLNELCTNRTKAIIAVHIYGQSADLKSISEFCQKNQIYLIEDVSQAHGAKYFGKRLGSIGIIGCFSCYPTKNLGAIGDAGLITTNNHNLNKKIRMIREYGWEKRISQSFGRNSRLDEIQAAVLNVKLKYLDLDNQKRSNLAQKYLKSLSGLPLKLPKIRPDSQHVFHQFVIQVENRKELISYLNKKGISPGIHYPVPIHKQPAYIDKISCAKDMKVTENIANRIISLPVYPELTISEITKITDAILSFYNKKPIET
jgi:dTDP-4-amino-4,6-dideoxygalactose transaminase